MISSYLCGERFSKFQKDYSDQVIFEPKFCFKVDRFHDHRRRVGDIRLRVKEIRVFIGGIRKIFEKRPHTYSSTLGLVCNS